MWVWSLNHWTRVSFDPSSDPGFCLVTFQIWANKHCYQHDDGSIFTSTAYERCQTPLTCLEGIWEPFHVGLEPEPVNNCFIWPQAVTQDFVWDSKSVPISIGMTAWWQIHIHIHSIWRLSNTFDMFGGDMRTISCGIGASTSDQGLHLVPSNNPFFQLRFLRAVIQIRYGVDNLLCHWWMS